MSSLNPWSTARRTGMTLVEVLVVVGIIALLVAILLPSLHRARAQARTSLCLSNLRQIGTGMGLYREAYRGWFPVGPADRILYHDYAEGGIYREPAPGRWLYPFENCHWGGKRAGYVHGWEWQGIPPMPETLNRPLTSYLYPGISLDTRTPLFECPADVGVSAEFAEANPDSAPMGPGQPYHYVCGNSYRINPWIHPWHDLIGVPKQRVRAAAQIILAEDASLDNGVWRFMPTPGWHGGMAMHNALFLDFHAQFGQIDTTMFHGPGWYLVNYFELSMFQY